MTSHFIIPKIELYGPNMIVDYYQSWNQNPPNALEMQLQTLTATVERLTQWNQELKQQINLLQELHDQAKN